MGTQIKHKNRVVANVSIIADNLLDKAYQSHLSRLKYADENPVTGRTGVFNMGRNFIFKLDIPLTF
jgi:iron complex outermembrane receptor protein